MAKKINTKALQDAIRAVLPEIKDAKNMEKYGRQAAAMIKLRTRLGSGVSGDGAAKAKLKPLADSTVQARAGKIGFFKMPHMEKAVPFNRSKDSPGFEPLHPDTSPKKSNLTHTGQMLDSIGVTKASYGSVTVSPHGERRGKGTKKLTNQKVAEYVTDAGRPFNNLSKVETKRLSDEVKRDLREAIKKRLTGIK